MVKKQILWRALFAVYAALMLWLLFGQRLGSTVYEENLADAMNLRPFATLSMYWKLLTTGASDYYVRHAVINLAGNVAMFVPLGFFLPSLTEKLHDFWKVAVSSLAILIVIEVAQFLSRLGTCDVDDLLLNMIGVTMGYFLWRLAHKFTISTSGA